MRNHQSYRSVFEKVSMYLDNELPKEEARVFLQEVRENPEMLKVLDREKSFKALIKNKIERRQVSPALIQSIKNKINTSEPI